MPRGVPKSGRRMTAKYVQQLQTQPMQPLEVEVNESDEEIAERITDRFDILEMLTNAAISGTANSVIVSGPAGLGKSYTVEQAVANSDVKSDFVRGYARATGIYKALYEHADGGIVIFDDCDAALNDEISLNILKAATDSTERRVISWRSESKMETEDGDLLPNSFEFNGSIIFITNLDFDQQIEQQSRLAPHLQAMISRAFYVDLTMKTRRDYFVRITQLIDQLTTHQQLILEYIEKNLYRLREVSLRTAIKLDKLISAGNNWRKVADNTLLRQR